MMKSILLYPRLNTFYTFCFQVACVEKDVVKAIFWEERRDRFLRRPAQPEVSWENRLYFSQRSKPVQMKLDESVSTQKRWLYAKCQPHVIAVFLSRFLICPYFFLCLKCLYISIKGSCFNILSISLGQFSYHYPLKCDSPGVMLPSKMSVFGFP